MSVVYVQNQHGSRSPQRPHPDPTTADSAGGASDDVRRRIVLTALALGHAVGSWDAVHVHLVARQAGVSLQQLWLHFKEKDAIADGCFDIADEALLEVAEEPGWGELALRERLQRAVMAWLDALAPHRRLVGEMLRYKIKPEHVHLQMRGVARISRTVQCIREVALLPSVGWRREVEEAALTTIYLTTFSFWLADGSVGSQRTRHLLARLLSTGLRAAVWLR